MSSLEEKREARRRRRMEELGALARSYDDSQEHDVGDMFTSFSSPSASSRPARTSPSPPSAPSRAARASPPHQAAESKSNVGDDDDDNLERKRQERRQARQAKEREGTSGGDEDKSSRRSRRNQEESSEDTPVAADTSADDAAEAERQEENRRRQREQAEEEERRRTAREEEEEEQRRKQEEKRRRQREEEDRRRREEEEEEKKQEERVDKTEQSKVVGESQHRQWERDKLVINGDHKGSSEDLLDNTKLEFENDIKSTQENDEIEREKRRDERRKKWEEEEQLAKEKRDKEANDRQQRREERRQRWLKESNATDTKAEDAKEGSDLKKQQDKSLSEQKEKSPVSESSSSSSSSNKTSLKQESHSNITSTSSKSAAQSTAKARSTAGKSPTQLLDSRIEQKRSSYDKPWLTKSPTGRSKENLADDKSKHDQSWKKRASGVSLDQRKEKFSDTTHKQPDTVPKKIHVDHAKPWNTRGDPQKPFGERRKMFESSKTESASQKSEFGNNSHVKTIDSSVIKNHSLKDTGYSPEEIEAVKIEKTLDIGRLERFNELEQQERLEQEKKGSLRKIGHEKLEKETLERECLEKEWLKVEQIEKQRLQHESLENERLENERLEQEQIEKEQLEHDRIEDDRLKWERIENERLEQEWIEQERLEREREETEQLQQKQQEEALAENENVRLLEKEQLEHERLGRERLKLDRLKIDQKGIDKLRGLEEKTSESLSLEDLSNVRTESGELKFRKDDDWRRKSVERQTSSEKTNLRVSHSRLDSGSKPSAGQVGLRKARFESVPSVEPDNPVTTDSEKWSLPKRDNLHSVGHDENRNKVSLLSKWKSLEAQSQSESTSQPARVTASQSKPVHIGKLKLPVQSPTEATKVSVSSSLADHEEPKGNVQSRWMHEKQVTETRTTFKVPASKPAKTTTKAHSHHVLNTEPSDSTVKKWMLKMEAPSTKTDKLRTASRHSVDSDLRLGRNIRDVSKTVGLFEERTEKVEGSSTLPGRKSDSYSVTMTTKRWGSSKELPVSTTTDQTYHEKYSFGENTNNNSSRKWSSQQSLSTANEFEQSSDDTFHKDKPVILKCDEISSRNNTPSQHDYEADTESLNYEASAGQGDLVRDVAADDVDNPDALLGTDSDVYTAHQITVHDRRLQRSRVEDFSKDRLDSKTEGHFREEITANVNSPIGDADQMKHMSSKTGVKTMLIIDPRNRGGPLEDGEEIVITRDHTTNIKFQPADYSTDDADSIEPDISNSAQSDDPTSARRDSLSDCSLEDYENRPKYISSDVLIGAVGYSGTDTLSSGVESSQNYSRLLEENDLPDQNSTTRWQQQAWEEREEKEQLDREKRKEASRKEEEKKKKKGKRKGLGGLSPEKKKFLKDEVDSGAFEASTDDNDDEDEQDKNLDDSYIKERDVRLRSRLEPLPGDLDKMGQADLQKLCKNLHQKVSNLEEEVYDWEVKIRKQDFDINELTLKVNDMKGKFVKPVLKKVSKTDAKLAKIGMKDAKDFRSNLKSTGQSKFALEDDLGPKTPDWRENVKKEGGTEAEPEAEPAAVEEES